MEILSAALRVGLGGLFVLSACGKLASPTSTDRMLQELGIWFPSAAAAMLILAEAAAAGLVFFPAFKMASALLVVALGASFGLSALVASQSRRVVVCACFGGAGRPLSPAHVARGAGIVAAGMAVLVLPYPWRADTGWIVLDATVTAAVALMSVRVVLSSRRAASDRIALSESTFNAVTA